MVHLTYIYTVLDVAKILSILFSQKIYPQGSRKGEIA